MHTVKRTINGKELSLETGRFAKLASGSIMVRYEDTMVLVTAVSDVRSVTWDPSPRRASDGWESAPFCAGEPPPRRLGSPPTRPW